MSKTVHTILTVIASIAVIAFMAEHITVRDATAECKGKAHYHVVGDQCLADPLTGKLVKF